MSFQKKHKQTKNTHTHVYKCMFSGEGLNVLAKCHNAKMVGLMGKGLI